MLELNHPTAPNEIEMYEPPKLSNEARLHVVFVVRLEA